MAWLWGRFISPGEATILTPRAAAKSINSVAWALVVVMVLLKWTCLPAKIAALPWA